MSIAFDINLELEGDILIRCRHINRHNERLTIFRAMFHTAFVDEFTLRFTKQELDCACNDPRFPDDFMVDFFFASSNPIDEAKATNFWDSLERHQPNPRKENRPQQASETDEEEEKINKELIDKYKHQIADTEENEDEDDVDIDDYLEQLEAKTRQG